MAGGTHVMMDTEGMYNKKMGVVLQNETLTDIVDLLEAIQSEDKALLLKRCMVPELPDRGARRSHGRPREMQGVQRDVMPPRLPPNSNDIKDLRSGQLVLIAQVSWGSKEALFLIRLRIASSFGYQRDSDKSICQYKQIFLLTPPYPAIQQSFCPSLEALLGPKGTLEIRNGCERLPFRIQAVH